ncbi:MAG: S8 family peptidase [Eubacterium sp.]
MRKVRQMLGINNLHQRGIMGQGVTVAVLDSGISEHPDFDDRIIGFKDFVNNKNKNYDDEGHGTHVAGIIAGNGVLSGGMFRGVAPRSNIVSIKVLDHKGIGKEDHVIDGIWWIIDNGRYMDIKVVNISFGTFGHEGEQNKRLVEAVELLWDMGYVVVAAAGNNGPGINTISTPGDSKKVITVGALNDNIKMIVNGKITMNYSGRGPTSECIQKPDVVAPANMIYSCCSLWKKNYAYVTKSGTSMATPIVSGTLCLLLSQYPELSNVECKKIIKNTAIDMKMDKNRQGWGRINPEKMLYFKRN